MAKPFRDALDPKPSQQTPRGKAIAAARERGETNWKKVFAKLDKGKKTSKR